MKFFNCEAICLWLLVVSGILWGLVGLFDFNLAVYLVGPSWALSVIYVVFGLAALCALFCWKSSSSKKK